MLKRLLPDSRFSLLLSAFVLLLTINNALAQTSAFTYQGKLTQDGNPANAAYDMQFKLFDAATNGNQIGATLIFDGTGGNSPAVSVSNGIFTVNLDFGIAALSGADRFLEISLRPAGNPGGYQQLLPRQELTSAPYAMQAVNATNAMTALTATNATNATQLGGVAASQYVVTSDARLTDARNPLPNSPNYVQNSTNQQASTNFNISGNGTAGGTLAAAIVDAGTQYRIAGLRVFTVTGAFNDGVTIFTASNTFAGDGAGLNTTPDGTLNDPSGKLNSFFGAGAGRANTIGSGNSYFGSNAGRANITGISNSFFGLDAGRANIIGTSNSFLGKGAGLSNTNGNGNTFLGASAGSSNTVGGENTFLGAFAGYLNNTGEFNTMIGVGANVGATNLVNATAIGHRALVSQSNSLVLGSINGINNAGADTNVGIGTTAPNARLHIAAGGGNILLGSTGCVPGLAGFGFASTLSCTNYAVLGGDGNMYINRPAGGTIIFREANGPNQVEIRPGGSVGIGVLDGGGSTQLCRNGVAAIATCSSSLRYKTEIQSYDRGLELIKQLRPIRFTWKQDGMRDVGFGAEDVAAVEPLLVTHNDKGQVEGVKYDRITVALVNAIREQQAQIAKQQQQIEALKSLVCKDHPDADVCRSN